MLAAFLLAITTFIQSFLPYPTVTEGVVGQPQYLNPVETSTNQIDRDIIQLVFRGITKYNEKGELIGDLAERWEISPDGKNYTFYLKNNVLWHDGKQLTADDIIYTASQYPQLRNIAIDKLNDFTVRFNLPDPFAPFLDTLILAVIPSHLAGKDQNLHPIGTGEFRFISIKKEDKVQEILLQTTKKPIKRLVFRFYDSEEDLITAAKLGEIDSFMLTKAPQQKDQEYLNTTFSFREAPLVGRYYAVFFNLTSQNGDINFRTSLLSATPKKRIIEEALDGSGGVVTGPLDFYIHSSDERSDSYIEPEESIHNTQVTLTIPESPTHQKTAEILRGEWGKLGVDVAIKPVKPGEIVEKVIDPKDFELLLLGQEVSRDPDRYILWHSTQKDLPGLNLTSFENPRADKALEEGRKFWEILEEHDEEALELDEETLEKERIKKQLDDRKFHYRHFRDVFDENIPAIFLYHPTLFYVTRNNVAPLDPDNIVHTPSDRLHSLLSSFR